MKLLGLVLHNYRGIGQLDLKLNGDSVVLIGSNGTGKSSILRSAALLISALLEPVLQQSKSELSVDESDISNEEDELMIKGDFEFGDFRNYISISMNKQGSYPPKPRRTINNHMKSAVNDIYNRTVDNQDVPIAVYYPSTRNALDIPFRIRSKHNFDQLSTYQNSMTGGVDFRLFFEWYRNQEDLENEVRLTENIHYEDPLLKTVRSAIYHFLPGFSDLRIMRKDKMRMVIRKGNLLLEINQLSDGEKCTLSLIGDLARRLALANPDSYNPLLGNGIVMIDEVDLHLHPEWQRAFVKALEQTFPNIQFLLTTHSPQVLGELENMKIIALSFHPQGNQLIPRMISSLYGKDSNLILEHYMGSSEQNRDVKYQLDQLFRSIMNGNVQLAGEQLSTLRSILGVEDPNIVKADLLLKRKGKMPQ